MYLTTSNLYNQTKKSLGKDNVDYDKSKYAVIKSILISLTYQIPKKYKSQVIYIIYTILLYVDSVL